MVFISVGVVKLSTLFHEESSVILATVISVVSWCCTDAPNMTSNITEILKYLKLRKNLLFSYKN